MSSSEKKKKNAHNTEQEKQRQGWNQAGNETLMEKKEVESC